MLEKSIQNLSNIVVTYNKLFFMHHCQLPVDGTLSDKHGLMVFQNILSSFTSFSSRFAK